MRLTRMGVSVFANGEDVIGNIVTLLGSLTQIVGIGIKKIAIDRDRCF